MSLTAASLITITMLVFALFFTSMSNVAMFMDSVEQNLHIHVVLNEAVTEEEAHEVKAELKAIPNVKSVSFSSKEEELELMIQEKGEAFEMYKGEKNPLSHAFFVTVKDSKKMKQTTAEIETLPSVRAAQYGGTSVTDLIRVLDTTKKAGIVLLAILSFIAIFLITNTIKITIHARAKEIAIMRNVGAMNWYIQIPFMFEGMFIGLLGSIVPCICSYVGYSYVIKQLGNGVIQLLPLYPFIFEVCGVIIISAMLVGMIGSFIATKRYLKLKR